MDNNKSDDILDHSSLSYIAQFQVHQKFIQAHLKGNSNDEPLLPAFFPPSSYWTSHEKDLFFHGLAVYSRFRPDLIAENIKTKTTFDVYLYLAILETASSATPSQMDGSFRDSLESAMEVSSTWIQNEEKMAAALIQFDSCTWTPGSTDGKTENPKNHCVCSPHSLLAGTSPLNQSSLTELKKPYLSHLDYNCLMALEKIVRDTELDGVDLTPVPSSSAASFGQSVKEEGLSNLISPKTSAVTAKKPDPLQSEAQYRLMKRLYMRRRRAQSAGRSANTEAIRLRPGRQTRGGKPSSPSPKTYKTKDKKASFSSSRKETLKKPEATSEADHVLVPSPADEMDQEEEEAQHELQSKGGLNKLNRTKDRFLEIGVDSQLASNNNLDFFHLSSLGRLMKFYGSHNDLTKSLSISADTIQLLVVVLEEFVSEVVHSCVVSKEQEIRMKGTTKVWKYDRQEITAGNVKKTLESMGITHSNVKACFTELVGKGKDGITSPDPSLIDTEMETDDDNADRKGDDDNQEEEEHKMSDEDTFVDPSNASNPSERSAELSQALAEFWLPESFKRCLLPKHTCNHADLLPEIDEIGLQRELAEEEELDARDLMLSKEFETGLWASCP